MDARPASGSEAARLKPPAERSGPSAFGWTILVFVLFYGVFQVLFHALPFVRNGSDAVFSAKLRFEEQGTVFSSDPSATRVLIFGNSKVLAGFLPLRFDDLSRQDHHAVTSFNSGFPGSDLFLPPLKTLCARGQAPQVLLLTLPWNADPPRRSIFHFVLDDHAVIEELFPFRMFLRDLSAFLLNAPSHGGVMHAWREARDAERSVIQARGYYLITEQSRFAGGRLPDDFHVPSDEPGKIVPRAAPAAGVQVAELNRLIRQYHMACFYVPFYLREGEAAPAAPHNERFAAQVAQNTGCRLIGPDYFLYPNRMFADQTHLNQQGAAQYTMDLYLLLKAQTNALQ